MKQRVKWANACSLPVIGRLRGSCMAASVHKPFILSRATASNIRGAVGEVRAPVNFRKHVAEFKYIDDRVFAFESSPSFAIPAALIDAAVKKNVAYYVSWTEGAEKKLQFEELTYKAKDGEVFQLKEPEQEREIVGPILELSGTKMHISKDYKSTLDFSKKLARATGVKKGWRVLDLFLGLGYSAGELLAAGASQVVCFEKYAEVIKLVQRNPYSPPLDKIKFFQQDVTKTNAFFALLEANATSPFDACIIDPAKKNVMLHVYSPPFLKRLASSLRHGASVVAYVPEPGISPRFQEMHRNLREIFEKSGYSFVGHPEGDKFISSFKR